MSFNSVNTTPFKDDASNRLYNAGLLTAAAIDAACQFPGDEESVRNLKSRLNSFTSGWLLHVRDFGWPYVSNVYVDESTPGKPSSIARYNLDTTSTLRSHWNTDHGGAAESVGGIVDAGLEVIDASKSIATPRLSEPDLVAARALLDSGKMETAEFQRLFMDLPEGTYRDPVHQYYRFKDNLPRFGGGLTVMEDEIVMPTNLLERSVSVTDFAASRSVQLGTSAVGYSFKS